MSIYYIGIDTIEVTIPAPSGTDLPDFVDVYLSRGGAEEPITSVIINGVTTDITDGLDTTGLFTIVEDLRVYEDIVFTWPVTGASSDFAHFVARGLGVPDITSEEFIIAPNVDNKYIGDSWTVRWSDIYSTEVVVLVKTSSNVWIPITDTAPNGNDPSVIDPQNSEQNDPKSGMYTWVIDLPTDMVDVTIRVADKDLWDFENPDAGEYQDFGPFNILERVLTTIIVSPTSKIMTPDCMFRFTAIAFDQSNTALVEQPDFVWSTDSSQGDVDSIGLFSASGITETCNVTATVGLISDDSSVNVTNDLGGGSGTVRAFKRRAMMVGV